MIAEGLRLTQYVDATIAVLGRLYAVGKPQNFCQIADFVFMGMADEPLLMRLMLTLAAEGYVRMNGRDLFTITADGCALLEIEAKHVINAR